MSRRDDGTGKGAPPPSGARATGMAGSTPLTSYLAPHTATTTTTCTIARLQSRQPLTRFGSLSVVACVIDDSARLRSDLHRVRAIRAVLRAPSFDLIDFCLDDALLPHSPSRYANLV